MTNNMIALIHDTVPNIARQETRNKHKGMKGHTVVKPINIFSYLINC